MIKLYYAPHTRANRPRWLLEELGVPYTIVHVHLGAGEQKQPEYRKIHPHGLVPALEIDGQLMFESAAICMYLADLYIERGLAPNDATFMRAKYYQWIVYVIATMEPPIVQYFLHTALLPPEKRSVAQAAEGKSTFQEISSTLHQALAGSPYLLGSSFSVCDVMVGSALVWADRLALLEGQPRLHDYLNRLMSRPAFQRAYSSEIA